jgi:hypothetical protein
MIDLADGGVWLRRTSAQERAGDTVLLDRGMDIGPASYGGTGFVSPTVSPTPRYYEPHGAGWLHTFGGGLMVGCGLTNVGNASEDDGESLGVHGRCRCCPRIAAAKMGWRRLPSLVRVLHQAVFRRKPSARAHHFLVAGEAGFPCE